MKQQQKERLCLPDIVLHVIVGWLFAVAIEYLLLPFPLRNLSGTEGLAQMSLLRVLIFTVIGAALFLWLNSIKDIRKAERWTLAGLFLLLALLSMTASFAWPYLIICEHMLIALLIFVKLGWNGTKENRQQLLPTRKWTLWVTGSLTVLFFLFVSTWTIARIYCLHTLTYDFGIFAQMFHYMRETGLPLTTLERDGLLSHFCVHMSPIYYLLLPFYFIAPHPVTLQILQAAVLASAVIPLWKIGKIHGLTDWQRMLLCALLLFYPSFAGGARFDIHENCFLIPLLLWLFYGLDKGSTPIIAVFTVLTLMVKEDAAVYVAVVALYQIVRTFLPNRDKNPKALYTGLAMLGLSLLWFFLSTAFLANVGDGVMTYRYDNFIYDGSASLITVVKAVIMNPMKAIFECVDAEKMFFWVMSLLPLLCLPLITRRYERYLLLIPFMLVNLMSDYPYQHDIFYQYTYGSMACLFYMTAVNLADMKNRKVLIAAVLAAAGLFGKVIVPQAILPPKYCVQYYDYCQSTREALAQIPEDVSVACPTSYTTTLSNRDILYDILYCTDEHLLSCEYVAVRESDKKRDEVTAKVLAAGYEIYRQFPGIMTIYRQPGIS